MEFNFVKMNKSKQWKTIIDVNEHAILQGEKLAKWQHINHNFRETQTLAERGFRWWVSFSSKTEAMIL